MLQRMQDTQRWLAEQHAALPDLPATLDGYDGFLEAVDAFWEAAAGQASGQPLSTRREVLALRLAQAVRDDAALRRDDGTLDDEANELAGTIARHPGGPLPQHLHARELLVGDMPYAGALLLQDDRHRGSAMLFTVEAGWQVFDSLDALYRDVELRMRAELAQRDELPGVSMEDMEAAIDTHFLAARAIDGDIFDTLARRLAARWRERIASAWKQTDSLEERRDALHDALDLHALLDVHGIVRRRDLALAVRRDEERLAGQPAEVRAHWRHVADGYRDSFEEAGTSMADHMPSLEEFTGEALAAALGERGIAANPRELHVRLRRFVPERPLADAIAGFPSENFSLPELAYRHLTAAETIEVVNADGTPRRDISPDLVRDIVRELDLPNRYASYLDTRFGGTPEGRARRASLVALQRAAMRFAAADARLSYYADTEPASFTPDRRERGFAWIKAVLDHPAAAGRARVEGHEIVVQQLIYKDAPLAGVFLFAARQRGAVARIVLYTPNAPDGLTFREFGDRAELDRRILLHPAFETYLLDRLPEEFGEVDAHGRRRFKVARLNGDRTLGWVFNTGPCQGCTELAGDFAEREVATSFLELAHDDVVALARRNAFHKARATDTADLHAVRDLAQWRNVPVLLGKEFLFGAAGSVPRTAQAAWRFYDTVKAGEGTDALLAFVDGYTSALVALPLYAQVPRLAGAYVRAAPGARRFVPSQRSLPAPDTLFEKRFLARGLAAPAQEPASGILVVDGHQVIRQGGKLYHVKFDPSYGAWRLSRPAAPDARFTGPMIERLADGQWHFRRAGLLGGGRGHGVGGSRFSVHPLREDPVAMLADSELLNPEVARLTMPQRQVVVDTLHARLPMNEYSLVLRRMLGNAPKPGRLSSTQRQAWQDALQAGIWAAPDAPSAAAGLPRMTAVPAHWWPEHVYAYLPEKIASHGPDSASIVLQELRVSRGLHVGIPVTTLPPTASMSSLPAGLAAWVPYRAGTTGATTLGAASGQWVRLNLRHLAPDLALAGGRSYQLYRVGETEVYLLRPVRRHRLHAEVKSGTRVRFFGDEFALDAMP